MIVVVNFEKQLREAYIAGAAAAMLHLKANGPKPDANAYLTKQQKSEPVIAKF